MRNRYEAERGSGNDGYVREIGNPSSVAYCADLRDAEKIADALNAAEERREVAKLREKEITRRGL